MTLEEAKRRLSRCAGLNLELYNRLRRLGQLQQRDQAEPLLQGSRAEAYARQIAPTVQANRRELAEVAAAVAALPDPLEREVLRLRYLEPCKESRTGNPSARLMPWKEIAAALLGQADEGALCFLSRLHRKALDHLARLWGT